ncbi:2'-5' RNA ligase family protein [Pilimelia columellifera]|uniref:2'-5' RNA ligase family protein n=1 Tax=Pilimelia columellifera subsp. columellifera TaxID=706583 RepID=A0ABP6AV42_9ACTN
MRRSYGVAFDIPEPWASVLTDARMVTGDPVATQAPAHVTLLPPTELPGGRQRELEEHLISVAGRFAPYRMRLAGTGTFRPASEVVYVAVDTGFARTRALAAALAELPDLPPSPFGCHPHVTVAHNVPTAELDGIAARLSGFTAEFVVDGFALCSHGGDQRWTRHGAYRLAG